MDYDQPQMFSARLDHELTSVKIKVISALIGFWRRCLVCMDFDKLAVWLQSSVKMLSIVESVRLI